MSKSFEDVEHLIPVYYNKESLLNLYKSKLTSTPVKKGIREILLNSYDFDVDKESVVLEYNDISKVGSLFDLVEIIERPSDEKLLKPLPVNSCYDSIPCRYLNAFILCTEPFFGIMIRTFTQLYGDDYLWDNACTNVDKMISNSDLSVACDRDDVIILSKSEDYYWLFYVGCSGNDSSIAKLDRYRYSEEQLKELLIRSVPHIGYQNEEYHILPKISKFIRL